MNLEQYLLSAVLFRIAITFERGVYTLSNHYYNGHIKSYIKNPCGTLGCVRFYLHWQICIVHVLKKKWNEWINNVVWASCNPGANCFHNECTYSSNGCV